MSHAQDVRRARAMEKEDERAQKACDPLHAKIKDLEAEVDTLKEQNTAQTSIDECEAKIATLRKSILSEWSWYNQMMVRD